MNCTNFISDVCMVFFLLVVTMQTSKTFMHCNDCINQYSNRMVTHVS